MADDRFSSPTFRAIADACPMLMFELNLNYEVQFANRNSSTRAVEDVLGRSVLDFVPADQHDAIRAWLEEARRTKQPGDFESMVPGEDGSALLWHARVAPIVENDEVTGFILIAGDVTSQHLATQAQRRFFNQSLDVLTVASQDDQTFLEVSDSLANLLGYDKNVLLNLPFEELFHPDDMPGNVLALESLLRGEDIIGFDNRMKRADGDYITLEWRTTYDPVTGYFFSVARDVTDARRARTQMRQSQRMEAVGQLAGSIAHDFNNLLLAIHGNVEFALELAPPEQREFLEHVQRASQRAAELTRQLLTFSRQRSAARHEVQVNEVARQLMSLLGRLIPANIEVELIAGHKLALVEGNEAQLEQVLLNLVLNARDAMPDGGRLTIETENVLIDNEYVQSHPWTQVGRYVLITVSDTGVGMGADIQERAFEPFFTTKGEEGGSGLGLATVYGIVQQHSGFVQIYSEPGDGTTMKVYLPAAARDATAVGDKIRSEPNGDREVVLVSEDQELVRSLVEKILDKGGYEVAVAENGYEALRLLRADPERYACLLLDVVTPEMSGTEAYERMTEVRPNIPVVFMSGYTDASRGDLLNDHSILTKPFGSAELLDRVRRAIQGEEE